MKRLFALSLLLMVIFSFAQEKFKVVYKSQMKIDLEESDVLSDASKRVGNDAVKEALKKAMEEVHYYELISKGDESSFKKIEKINNDLPNDGKIQISFSPSGGLTYKDLKTKQYLDEASDFGKDYIITDTLKVYDWKLTREKSKILNYNVRKATAVVDSAKTLEAWYTTQIPIKSGPGEYWGLPGLILKIVNKYDGKEKREFFYEATEISVLDDKEPLEKPTKGKFISREDFNEEQDKQMEKFKEMRSGGVDTTD